MRTKIWIVLLLTAALLCGCTDAPLETESATEPLVESSEAATTEATVPETTEPTAPIETEPQEERFTLTFAGDCTLGSNPANYHALASFPNLVGEDYGYPFRNVLEYFENDDFTMVNLEGVLGLVGYPAEKTFTFRGPAEYVNILTENSVEAVTLANNHSLDYGRAGYESTTNLLTEAEVTYVEKDSSALYTTESGLTVGLYAASFVIDQSDLEAEVAALREQGAEVVVFAIHWGAEGYYYPLSHQVQQAYDAIDAGVDIVYGSHPHVLQKIEEYNGGIIFYSMGNFSFGGNHHPNDMDTVVLQQEVIRYPDGTVSLGELTIIPACISSTSVNNNFQPTPYEVGSAAYERVLSKLDGSWTGRSLTVDYSGISGSTESSSGADSTGSTGSTESPDSAESTGSTESTESEGSNAPAPDPAPAPTPEDSTES